MFVCVFSTLVFCVKSLSIIWPLSFPQSTPRFASHGGRTPFRGGRGGPSFGGRGAFIPSPPRFQRGGGRFPFTPGRGGPGRGTFGRGPPGSRTPARIASLYADNYYQESGDQNNADHSYDDQYWSQASGEGYADPNGYDDSYYQNDQQEQGFDYASHDADAHFQVGCARIVLLCFFDTSNPNP